jgi:chlorite dismutase
MYRGGLNYMRYSVSDTAEHGDYTGGPRIITDETRQAMRKMLKEIQDGTYARNWIAVKYTYRLTVTRAEHDALAARQPPLGRPEATRAALIPIRKTEAWWALSQDERRAVFEERSHHIAIGLEYLPSMARRLHHCRDLGEPFDFLTWFEYAPSSAAAFEQLVARLRATEEWSFVEREIDLRLSRVAAP